MITAKYLEAIRGAICTSCGKQLPMLKVHDLSPYGKPYCVPCYKKEHPG